MIVYLHSKCSTCQKALRLLKDKNIAATIKDISENPPTIAELRRMLQLQNGNIKKLLNTSGILYRQMQLSVKLPSMQIDEILDLLSRHGMRVKRPFVIDSHFGLTGFNETEWTHTL